MVKKFAVIFAVCLFVLYIFSVGIFAAVDKKKAEGTKLRVPAVIESETYFAPSKATIQYPTGGTKATCDYITPDVGTKIQHDQIGHTYYDYQANGTIGRMIDVTSNGYRHFTWMYGAVVNPPERQIAFNCKDPMNNYLGQTNAGVGADRPGYSRANHLNDGRMVAVHHLSGTPVWNTALTVDDGLCGGFFTKFWDVPDQVPTGGDGIWPEAAVVYDPVEDKDYIHIVTHENADIHRLGYVRCYFGLSDTLICQTYLGTATTTYRIPQGTYAGGSFAPIGLIDSTCFITATVEASPISKRVAIVYMRPAFCVGMALPCDYNHDVAYIESMNNGADLISGLPVINNITNYGCQDERGAFEVSACYDYEDSLHIVWITGTWEGAGGGTYTPGWSRLYHWSEKAGITNIATGEYAGARGPINCSNIHKPSIAAKNPMYHPEGDSVYLFVIWSQTDTLDLGADRGFSNCDLWGTGSFDGGAGWGAIFNLTRTNSDSCLPGACVSEEWPSLATNMYDGDLHIQYICDLDPGAAWHPEGIWTDNPVMYLHLTEWEVTAECRTTYVIEEPAHWYGPPLKVPPGGTRDLAFKVQNIGNAGCSYTVSSDDPCIDVSAGGSIPIGGEVPVSVTVKGYGACENTFIDGNVILWTSEGVGGKTDYLPVQAVAVDDYYECPRDEETDDTLENTLLRLYVNANCQEWIFDIGTFQSATGADTVHEVFFQGGTIVATTKGLDTLVGRWMGDNDRHSGAREKLHVEDFGDYSVLYSWNIFMHDLNPPVADTTWWWWEMLKEVVFFNSGATDARQHVVIKYVTVERHDPPGWWPDQTAYTGHQDTYIGVAMDIDAPWDSMGSENGRNRGGYDATNFIAWQRGWDYTGAHPTYNDYYCGIALANGGGGVSGEEEPYGSYCVKNNTYLYPQSPWGWKEGELYRLASTPGNTIQDGPPTPDSIVDRTYVFTAQKMAGGVDPNARASFTVVEVAAPGGLTQLQDYVDTARVWVQNTPLILCGDVNGDHIVNVGDIIHLLNYLYKNYPPGTMPPPVGPVNRADVNSDGVINVGDIIHLLNYLYKNYPPGSQPDPNCPGIW